MLCWEGYFQNTMGYKLPYLKCKMHFFVMQLGKVTDYI